MAVLICRPVSPRSKPEKILRWIAQLEDMRNKHAHDPQAVATIEHCLSQARNWV
ncbi:MAG TPA: hypothetical protein VGR27_01750 [Longimicrobiaceae bacterium]|nr:hypothetical protein [Longimicrobiaceae bacterium]